MTCIKVVVTGRKLPSWKVYQGLNDTMGMWEHKNQHENLPPESIPINPSGPWPKWYTWFPTLHHLAGDHLEPPQGPLVVPGPPVENH